MRSRVLIIVKRCPILIARICGIFCALRKYEMGYTGVEMEATEEDVEIALKIAITFLRHTCVATTMLIKDDNQANKLKSVFTHDDLFYCLPKQFRTADLTELCVKNYHLSVSSVYRILDGWIEKGLVKKIKQARYGKTGKLAI